MKMFPKMSATVFTFVKKNYNGVLYATSIVTGLTTFYYVNKDAVFPDRKPHYASFFSSKSDDIDLKDILCDTITDEKVIRENKHKMRYRMEAFITNLQGKIIKQLQDLETDAKFQVDRWMREEGGGGITCIVQDGSVLERAAVNISVVSGTLPPAAVAQMRSRGKSNIPTGKSLPFIACGISSVIHPRNPNVPTLHFNYRFFEVEIGPNQYESWFGGGTDLTPYYLDEEDVVHFHKTLKEACDKHDKKHYPDFKKWCDDYFVITHRNENRGVGGIFFDDFDRPNQEKAFEFVKSCGNAVMPSYIPIVKKNMSKGYGLKERDWQLLRRGKYVEFNLVYDRGTKFGLMTPGAKIESILVSLPAVAKWTYKHKVEVGSEEYKLQQVLNNPRDWV